MADFGQILNGFGLVNIASIWPTSGQACPDWGDIRPASATLVLHRPSLVRLRAISTKIGPESWPEGDAHLTKYCTALARVGPNATNHLTRLRPMLPHRCKLRVDIQLLGSALVEVCGPFCNHGSEKKSAHSWDAVLFCLANLAQDCRDRPSLVELVPGSAEFWNQLNLERIRRPDFERFPPQCAAL